MRQLDAEKLLQCLLPSLHWLPIKLGILIKIFIMIDKFIRGPAPSSLEELAASYQCWFTCGSQSSKSRMGAEPSAMTT